MNSSRITKIFLGLFIILMLGGSDVSGASTEGKIDRSVIKLGDAKVHPELVFAKLREPKRKNINNLLERAGFSVVKKYNLVDGLLLVNVNGKGMDVPMAKKPRYLQRRIAELEGSGLFVYVEPNYYKDLFLSPNDSAYTDGDLWGLINAGQKNGVEDADIDADEAWSITTGNKDTIVAVIDSGVRWTHQDLAAQMWINKDEVAGNGVDDDGDGYIDNVNGIDPYWGDGLPEDDIGHGTHVAGTIGAAANDGNPHVGVAWDVQLLACKVGSYFLSTDAIIDSIEFIIEEDVSVANCSFGGMNFSQAEFDAFAAGGVAGIMFACAAGNYSMNNDNTPFYPCSFDLECVISVAATNNKDFLTSFTHWGEESVDLAAPGEDIYSSVSDSDNSYDVYSGTSMASPHVAGVLALMRGLQPVWSNLQIREKFLASVDVMDSYEGLLATSGRLNAFKAVDGMTAEAGGIPDGIMEVAILPPSGSMLLAGTSTDFFATVIDGVPVTDATVEVLVEMDNSLEGFYFGNDGDIPDAAADDGIYSNTFMLPKEGGKLKMTIMVSAPGKENYYRVAKYDVVPIPGNDDFQDAYKITGYGQSVEGFNTFATLENNEPLHRESKFQTASLWWDWVAPADGTFYADVAGSEIDAILAVYVGDTLVELRKMGDNLPESSDEKDYVKWKGRKGRTYRICIAGVGLGDTGYVRLRVEVNGEEDIAPPYIKIKKPINGISVSTNRIELAGIAMDPQPNASGLREVVISKDGKPGITVTGNQNWSLMVNLQPGLNNYDVYGVDYSGNISKPAKLTIDHRPPDVPNDHFVDAIRANTDRMVGDGEKHQYVLSQKVETISSVIVKINNRKIGLEEVGVSEVNAKIIVFNDPPRKGDIIEVSHPSWVSILQDTTKATRENGEPYHANNEGAGSIWYSFMAPSDGVLTVSTINGTFDTLLGMYIGGRVGQLDLLAENDEDDLLEKNEDNPGFSRIEQALEEGMLVHIALDGFGGERGLVRLATLFEAKPIHRLSVVANGGGVLISPISQPLQGVDGNYTLFVHDGLAKLEVKADSGFFFEGWKGSINSMDNPLDLFVTEDISIFANFGPIVLAESFETGDLGHLQWRTSGDSGWIVQSEVVSRGQYAARSGAINDGQISSLVLEADFSSGEGSFDFLTSTEKTWDKLVFLINGIAIKEWSGIHEWRSHSFNLSQGSHVLEWRYQKDFASSFGEDAVWLDNIGLPLRLGASLALEKIGDSARLRLWGRSGHRYDIEVSTDFATWEKWDSIFIDNTGVKLLEKAIELNASDTRFFRAVAP